MADYAQRHRSVTPWHKPQTILPLTLENLQFKAQGQILLNVGSCAFDNPGCAVILGPNGAGKTLLLNIMHGLLAPSTGRVRWGHDDPDRIRKGQAMIFQRPVMLRRSVRANVDFALKYRGLEKNERAQRVAEALEISGLSNFQAKSARLLSFGQQQSLALARVWALRPDILFMDEATANLDPPSTFKLERLVGELKAQGVRIIMTTHDLGQAQRLGDEIVFIHGGRLLERTAGKRFFAGPQSQVAQAFLRGDLISDNNIFDETPFIEPHKNEIF